MTLDTDKTGQHPDALLPWLVNGTLGGAERLEVEAHVATCKRCRRELAFLNSLRGGVAELEQADAPGEFGLKRLMRDVRRRPQTRAQRRWLAPALAASLAVIVIQGALLVQMTMRSERIVPLGGETSAGIVLQIRFDPHASEADIRAALQSVGASLIDGPGALGVYRAALRPDATGKAMETSQAIAILGARSGVVTQVVAESRGGGDAVR